MITRSLAALVLAGASAASAGSYPVPPTAPAAQPAATIISEVVVAQQPGRYMGWPDIITTPSGELIAVFSGDRDWHVDPWGKVMAVRSTDGGATWSEPELWADTPLDDRGTGVEVFPDGTLFVSYEAATTFGTRTGPPYDQWKDYYDSLTPAQLALKGYWGMRSTDNGQTWQPATRMPGMSPHGPTLLSDGRLLFVGGGPVHESSDGGLTWQKIGDVPNNPATWKSAYAFMSEPVSVETADGRIIALARYRDGNDIGVRQTESTDGGHTWSEPHNTGMQGFPPHVVRLDNGWLVASYGRRINPMGQRATVSLDNGYTWLTNFEIVLSNAVPQPSGDLGYPASAVLPDGTIWTVYYQTPPGVTGEYPAIMGTHWKLTDAFNAILFFDSAENVAAGSKPTPPLGSYLDLYTTNSVVTAGVGANSLGQTHPDAIGGGNRMLLVDRPDGIGRRHMGVLETPVTEGYVRFEADLMNKQGWMSFGMTSADGGLTVAGTPVAFYITLADDGTILVYDPAGTGWTLVPQLTHTVGQWQKYALEYVVGQSTFTLTAGDASVTLDAFAAAGLTSVSRIDGFGILAGTTTGVGYIDNIIVSVPEPATLAILAVGLVLRRQRKLKGCCA